MGQQLKEKRTGHRAGTCLRLSLNNDSSEPVCIQLGLLLDAGVHF